MTYTDYPKAATENAKRALKYREESGNPKDCGTPVGWARANQLAKREAISEDTVKRMASFNRHRQHKDVPYDEGCGGLMWDAWGGTEGVDWAIRKSKEIDEKGFQPTNDTMNLPWKTKSTSASVKGVDMDRRIIEGYYSIFDFKDSDGDVMLKGCYEKTLKENGPNGKNRIMHLYQHDPLQVLGKPMTLMEDEKGLYFRTMISDTELGNDVLKLYRDGILTEHSVGINFIQREYDSQDDAYLVKEVKMWEGSTVTWGANEMAIGGMAKGSQKDQVEKYKELSKAFYSGDYTDETFRLIEAQLKHLEQSFKDSLQTEKPVQPTLKEEAETIEQVFKTFNQSFNLEKEFQKWT